MKQTFEIVGLRAVHEDGDLKLFVDLAAPPEAFIRREKRIGGRPLVRSAQERAERTRRLVQAHMSRRPGVTQQVVLRTLSDLAVVDVRPKVRQVVNETIERMPYTGGRDTHRQRVVRALELLVRSGHVQIREGRVVC